jgi:hypothetical protein
MKAMAQVDHLVIGARSLGEGVDWCEATLGVTPAPGGSHALMGTQNRLLAIASDAFPACYLEIIAVDPHQRPTRARHKHRWYDLDDPVLQHGLAQHGPQLIHFVARVPDAHAGVHALAAEPTRIARGHVIHAARDTPVGRLEWHITVRDDGQRLFYGTLPTLIQWGAAHPTDRMPASGIALAALAATHPRADTLATALRAIRLDGEVQVEAGPPNLIATLETPRGRVTLESKGL